VIERIAGSASTATGRRTTGRTEHAECVEESIEAAMHDEHLLEEDR
jgi:hypothetical protein